MHIFTDYIQPLTLWLYDHPQPALFITFLISFGESLAIVGSIIPGSVTMTAIGILAGSGVMRIDLTYLAAILGAIAGDSGSYALGYTYSDRLINIWPFKRYPAWLSYGKDYFARHGATSILIGRFVGPIRSIIPVIAGMMHMNHWHFLIANATSAIAWSILYVTPGVLIGAASSELSTENSTRLFLLILILLIILWLMSLAIKWLLFHTNQFLRIKLHTVWSWLDKRPGFTYFTKRLVPKNEVNHYPTAAFTLVIIFCFFISIITTVFVVEGSWVTWINSPVYLYFQSLRTQPFDVFFIMVSLLISPLPLLTLMLATTIFALYYRDWRTLRYWLSLCLFTSVTLFFLKHMVKIPIPHGFSKQHPAPLFPDLSLTFATSLFGFFIFYISSQSRMAILLLLRILLLTILFLAGVALIYLGDNWITSVIASYFFGLTICLLHWIVYRRHSVVLPHSELSIMFSCALLILAICIANMVYFKKCLHIHNHQIAQYVMTDTVWWNQKQPLLPIYSTNRIGKRMGLLNIQYVGSIKKFQQALEDAGWKQRSDSFFYSLLIRASGHRSTEEIPLITELYQNKKPTIVMTYSPANRQGVLILRLWRSNYHLQHYRQPIWLGSADRLPTSPIVGLSQQPQRLSDQIAAYNFVSNALTGFKFNRVTLPHRFLKSLPKPASPILLIIKDPNAKEETSF